MEKMAPKKIRGYILLEILIGLFIVGLGFTVILGVTNTLKASYTQTHQLLQAVNLASSTMEEVLFKLKEDRTQRFYYLQDVIMEEKGIYNITTQTKWHGPELIQVIIKIRWGREGMIKNYDIESIFYVQE